MVAATFETPAAVFVTCLYGSPVTPLRACLATAVREGLIRSGNPARDVDLPHRPTAEESEEEEVRAMSHEELSTLLGMLPDNWRMFFLSWPPQVCGSARPWRPSGWRSFCEHQDRARLTGEMNPIQDKLRELLGRAARKSKRTRLHRRFANNLLKIWPALWTFVTIDGVEPTNNSAERGTPRPRHPPQTLPRHPIRGRRAVHRARPIRISHLPPPRPPPIRLHARTTPRPRPRRSRPHTHLSTQLNAYPKA